MKITLDKQFTSLEKAPMVKEAMKEFKARYTDADVRNALTDYFESKEMWDLVTCLSGEILKVELAAAPRTMYQPDNDMQYAVELVVSQYMQGFTFARYYIDQELKINCGNDLITVRAYNEPTVKF